VSATTTRSVVSEARQRARKRARVVVFVLGLMVLAELPLGWLALSGLERHKPDRAASAVSARIPPVVGSRLLIGHGAVQQPQLLAVTDGWVGWWLSGSGRRQTLTVALLNSRHGLVRQRTIPVTELVGRAALDDAPLFAAGPNGQLVFLWRAVNAARHTAALGMGTWNVSLAGAPRLRWLSSVPLVDNAIAIDTGPHGQYLAYEPAAGGYLLVEERLQPWFAPAQPKPNRPQLLVTLASPGETLLSSRTIPMPPAQSFIDPLVRVDRVGGEYHLFVVRPGDNTKAGPEPDELLLYRLDSELRVLAPTMILARSSAAGSIMDEAVCPIGHGRELLVWEAADPESGGGQVKHVLGMLLASGHPASAPFLVTDSISPYAQSAAQLFLAPARNGAVLSFNTGASVVFAAVSTTGQGTDPRVLFQLTHLLYLQPAAGIAYAAHGGALGSIWQDPGTAVNPANIGRSAPLYLSVAGT